MYERYKGVGSSYSCELERILVEDCKITGPIQDPDEKKWKTSTMIDRENAEKKA